MMTDPELREAAARKLGWEYEETPRWRGWVYNDKVCQPVAIDPHELPHALFFAILARLREKGVPVSSDGSLWGDFYETRVVIGRMHTSGRLGAVGEDPDPALALVKAFLEWEGE